MHHYFSGHSLFSISLPEVLHQHREWTSTKTDLLMVIETLQLWKSINGNRSEEGIPPRGRHPRKVNRPEVATPSEGVMKELLTRNLDMIEPVLSKVGLVGQEQTESNSQSDSLLLHQQPQGFITIG